MKFIQRALRAIALGTALGGMIGHAIAQDLEVEPGGYTDHRQGLSSWTSTGTKNALAAALLVSDDGDEIGFRGHHGGVHWGTGNPTWTKVAVRSKPFRDITIYGLDDTAVMEGFAFGQSGGGMTNPTLRDFTIEVRSQSGIIVNVGTHGYGVFTVEGILFTNPIKACKWVMRMHGSPGFLRVVNCHAPEGAQEHFLYANAVQGAYVADCTADGMKRTMLQFVTRYIDGIPGTGLIEMARNRAYRCGANGASAFTVAGHLGDVIMRDNSSYDCAGGSVVVYADHKMRELDPTYPAGQGPAIGPGFMPADGKGACNRIDIIGHTASHPNPDRDLILLQGFRHGHVYPPRLITANGRAGIHINYNGQGYETFAFEGRTPPSQQRGWQMPKVNWKETNNAMSPAEADAKWNDRGGALPPPIGGSNPPPNGSTPPPFSTPPPSSPFSTPPATDTDEGG